MVVDASEDKNEERRQVRASGCVVRLGVSKASPLVGELDGGTIVSINRAATAIASADEPLRVKMTKPLQGWVSFKCLGAAPDERGDPDRDAEGFSLGGGRDRNTVSLGTSGAGGGWRDEFTKKDIAEMRRRSKAVIDGTADSRSAHRPIAAKSREAPRRPAAAPPPRPERLGHDLPAYAREMPECLREERKQSFRDGGPPTEEGQTRTRYIFKGGGGFEGDFDMVVEDKDGTRTVPGTDLNGGAKTKVKRAKPKRWRQDYKKDQIALWREKARCEVLGLTYWEPQPDEAAAAAAVAVAGPAPSLPPPAAAPKLPPRRETVPPMNAFARAATAGLQESAAEPPLPPEPEDWQANFRQLAESARGGEATLYDTLGVDRTMQTADLKGVYRALAREHHPDRSTSAPGDDARMQKINEAYAVLSDKNARRHYDRILSDASR